MALLKDLDIPAMIISSSIDDHAWNMVYINGEWYFYDVTWEDSDGIDDEYFFYYELSLEDLKIDHRFDESNSELLSYDDYVDFAEYVFGY